MKDTETGGSRRESSSALEEISDFVLVERALDQDAEAFRTLVDRYSSLMRAYVYRIVGTLSETDDVVQEAFVTAWRQLPTLRDPSAVKAWLMRIASRQAFAHLKRRPADIPLELMENSVGSVFDPEERAIRNAQLRALSEALSALPENQRRCWLLREVAELSYTEIADEMDIPPSTVRGHLARARASITVRMEGWR